MNNSQSIEPPKKSGDRNQISFNLNGDEVQLKKEFSKLVGARGTKPVLVQFMRRYVELGGKGVTVSSSVHPMTTGTDPALTPRDQRERELVAGLLLLFRDKREIAQGVKEIVAGLLSNWINKAKAAIQDLNGGERSA